MPATKTAPVARKNAKKVVATKAPVAPAKQAKPVPAKKEAAAAKRTAVVEAHVSRNEQGRLIQDMMTKSLLTVAQLAERTGFSETRVLEHVNYEISKTRSKLNGKKQVVVISQPIRRNAG